MSGDNSYDDEILVQDGLVKHLRLHQLIAELRAELPDLELQVMDHWDADFMATGLISKNHPKRLIYVAVPKCADDGVCLVLEQGDIQTDGHETAKTLGAIDRDEVFRRVRAKEAGFTKQDIVYVGLSWGNADEHVPARSIVPQKTLP